MNWILIQLLCNIFGRNISVMPSCNLTTCTAFSSFVLHISSHFEIQLYDKDLILLLIEKPVWLKILFRQQTTHIKISIHKTASKVL